MPVYTYYPSVTWIAGHYPKGIPFYKWLADRGWDEAEAIKNAAGDKGSKVHKACEDIDMGVKIDVVNAKYVNNSSGQPENLTREEVDCIISYSDFIETFRPILLANERTCFGKNYAGTIDKIFRVNGQIWILDIKTSKNIWEEFKLQLSAYSHADIDYKKLGITDDEWAKRKLYILQVGYKKNKDGYKLTELEDKFFLFEVAYLLWKNENPSAKPVEAFYPLFIQSDIRVKEAALRKVEEEKLNQPPEKQHAKV